MKINTEAICTDLLCAKDVAKILQTNELNGLQVIYRINKKLRAEGKITCRARIPYDSLIEYMKKRKKGVTYADYKYPDMLNYKDVALILHIQQRSASNLIRKLNRQLKAKGEVVYVARISYKNLMNYLRNKKRGITYADYKKSKEQKIYG